MTFPKFTASQLQELAQKQSCIYLESEHDTTKIIHVFTCNIHYKDFKLLTAQIDDKPLCPDCRQEQRQRSYKHPFRAANKYNLNLTRISEDQLAHLRQTKDVREYYEFKVIQPVLKEIEANIPELHLDAFRSVILVHSRVILDYFKENNRQFDNPAILIPCLLYFFAKPMGMPQDYCIAKNYCTPVTMRSWYKKIPFEKLFLHTQLIYGLSNYVFFNLTGAI